MWLFGLFLVIPLIEIWLFITVGGLIGVWPTIGLVLLTAVVGALLVRAQGMRAWLELQSAVVEFRDPSRPLAHGAMILFAGALLMTPGFFTDVAGILLLFAPVRDWVMRRVGRRVRVSQTGSDAQTTREPHRPPFGDGVIDADFVELDPGESPRPDRPSQGDQAGRASSRPGRRGDSGWTRH